MSGAVGQLGRRYFGVYLGTVVDVDDPDGLGRVRLDTDQYEDTEEDPTWAAVSRPLAGAASTVFFTPKPDDQVVVAFLAGDVRQPIVMGYAHTTERTPGGGTPERHTLNVDGLGSITFDEENDEIVVEQTGSRSVTLTLSGGRLTVRASEVVFEVDRLGVNGHGVVLGPFLNRFDGHQHAVPSLGSSDAPTPAVVPITPLSTESPS